MAALLLSLLGCATGINSPTESVLISSEPMGAEVVVDDRFYTTTPGKVRLSRLSAHVVRLEKEGYESAQIEVDRGMSWWVFTDLSCLLWVVSCVSQDMREGGFFTLDKEVHVQLTKSATVSPAVSMEAPPGPTLTLVPAPLEVPPEPAITPTSPSEPLAEAAPLPTDTEPTLTTAPEPSPERAPEAAAGSSAHTLLPPAP
jgi:PEGA domain